MNISGKVESTHVTVYRDVSNAAKTFDMPFVVVGAAARDLVPFVPIATVDGDVLLPPKETHKMNVVGFQEVCDSADQVTIQTKPQIVIPVATPAGVVLLKIIAWTDRAANLRKKDASDMAYLMENYEKIPEIIDTLYDDASVLERFDWNTALAGAFVLGRDTSAIASKGALGIVTQLRNGEFKNRTLETLEYEMCRTGHDDAELERKGELLKAFIQGFYDED